MLPPVRLNVDSMSTGDSIWRSMTDAVKPGACSSTIAKHRSANSLRLASFHPPLRSYGAYWQNIDMRCLPSGATLGSTADGIVHSTIGLVDIAPYFASSYARSMKSWSGQRWIVPRCCGPGVEPGHDVKFGSADSATLIFADALE